MNILLYEHAQPLQLAAQEMDRDPSHADECTREGGRVEPGRPCTIHEAPKKDMNEAPATAPTHITAIAAQVPENSSKHI